MPMKFALDPCSGFRKSELMDNVRTDDGSLRHDSSSADKVKQSEVNILLL